MSVINRDVKLKYYEYSSETAKKYKVIDWFVLSIGLMFFSCALFLEVIITDFLLYHYKYPYEVTTKITCGNMYVILSIFFISCVLALVKGTKSLLERNIIFAIDDKNTLYQYNFRKNNGTLVLSSQLDDPLYAILISYIKIKEATKKVDISNDALKSIIKFDEIPSCIVKDKYFILKANVSKTNRRGRVKHIKYRKKIYKQYEGIENLIEFVSRGLMEGGN